MHENPLVKVIAIVRTQAELARRINAIVPPEFGVSPQAINKWEFIPESRALDVEAVTDGEVSALEILEYAKLHRRTKEVAA